MDTNKAQQITDRSMQGILNSRGLHRSESLGNIAPPLPAAAYFSHPQIGASPALRVPTLTDTVTPMPGEGARLMPNGGARRSVEGPSILNIPPSASHDVRDDENLTLH